MDFAEIRKRFTYHPPKKGQPEIYEDIRAKALEFAELLYWHCPDSNESAEAIKKVEMAVMWANAAIARHG